MRKILLLLSLWVYPPSFANAQTVVSDSVLMNRHVVSYYHPPDAESIYYHCGAFLYATWPDVASRVLKIDATYNTYRLVATEGMYVPSGWGQQLSDPDFGISIPDTHFGHNPALGGGVQSGSPPTNCGMFLASVEKSNSGAPGGLNGAPFQITEWYAVYDIPPGTPIAEFQWEQTGGLEISFDASFESEQSREVEVAGKVPVSTYAWDFGDSTFGSGAKPVHSYSESGYYDVQLIVTDNDSEQDTVTYSVNVSGPVLEYQVQVQQEATVGQTILVTTVITNTGTESVATMTTRRDFTFVPTYPDVQGIGQSNASHTGPNLEASDLTITNLGPGSTIDIVQSYTIDNPAKEYRDGVQVPIPVDWRAVLIGIGGVDEFGEPVLVVDRCDKEPCNTPSTNNTVRVRSRPMFVDVLSASIDGTTDEVPSGLKRRVGGLLKNGRSHTYNDGSGAKCYSGCIDLEITVTEAGGVPVENAIIELSRVLLDTDANGTSNVTPDQGGGIFCDDSKCGKTLKLSPTDSEGKQKVTFWTPGVVWPVDAFITAKATKDGFDVATIEEEIRIVPTRIDFGKVTSTPSAADLTALSVEEALRAVLDYSLLGDWCKWGINTLGSKIPIAVGDFVKKAFKSAVDYGCGESLDALDDKTSLEVGKTLEVLDTFKKIFDAAAIYWFFSEFDMSASGTAEIVIESFLPPFLGVSSDFVDGVLPSTRGLSKQFFLTGATPLLTLDLFEVSHKKENGELVWALHYRFTTTGASKVDEKKFITAGYDKRIFLQQERREGVTSAPSVASDQTISTSGPGKLIAAQDSIFEIGHVVTIDLGAATEESAQIVGITDSALELSVPLKFDHAAGATVTVTDSIAVGPPEKPIAGNISGAPVKTLTPTLEWYSRAPAESYSVDVATDTTFSNTAIVQSYRGDAETSVELGELDDRKTYYWRVAAVNSSGQGEWSNTYSLFTGRPIGDDLAEALTLEGGLGTSRMTFSVGATAEANEALASCGGGDNSMWFAYTPTADATVALETFVSGHNTVLSVWTGSAHPLTEVACNDDHTNPSGEVIEQSYLEFAASGGTTYYIRVAGVDNEEGIVFTTVRNPTQVSIDDEHIVDSSKMSFEIYPNPTTGTASIAVSLPQTGLLTVEVYDLLARRVAVVARGNFGAGQHELAFDGRHLPAGVYLIKTASEDAVSTRLMTIAR